MVEFISANTRLAFARESSLGSNPAAFGGSGGSTSPRFLGITNQTIEFPDQEVEYKQYRTFGEGRSYFLNKAGRRIRRGSIPFLPTSGELFFYALGSEATSGTTDITHTLTPQDSAVLPSMALRADNVGDTDANFRRTFLGTVVNNLSVTANENGEMSVTMETLSKDVQDHDSDVTDANLTATAANLGGGFNKDVYMFYDFDANITIGGTTYARVKSYRWSINNNNREQYFFQSSNAQDPFGFTVGYPDFSLSMDIVPAGHLSGDTDSLYHLLEDDSTLVDVVIPHVRTATSDELKFTFDDCALRAAPHSWTEDGNEITVSAEFLPEDVTVTSIDNISAYASA